MRSLVPNWCGGPSRAGLHAFAEASFPFPARREAVIIRPRFVGSTYSEVTNHACETFFVWCELCQNLPYILIALSHFARREAVNNRLRAPGTEDGDGEDLPVGRTFKIEVPRLPK